MHPMGLSAVTHEYEHRSLSDPIPQYTHVAPSRCLQTSHSSSQSRAPLLASSVEVPCIRRSWGATYHVTVGRSWGSLPVDLQVRWASLGCDREVQLQQLVQKSRTPRQPGEAPVFILQQSGAHAKCVELQISHSVVVKVDWGTLPISGQREWLALGCDKLV